MTPESPREVLCRLHWWHHTCRRRICSCWGLGAARRLGRKLCWPWSGPPQFPTTGSSERIYHVPASSLSLIEHACKKVLCFNAETGLGCLFDSLMQHSRGRGSTQCSNRPLQMWCAKFQVCVRAGRSDFPSVREATRGMKEIATSATKLLRWMLGRDKSYLAFGKKSFDIFISWTSDVKVRLFGGRCCWLLLVSCYTSAYFAKVYWSARNLYSLNHDCKFAKLFFFKSFVNLSL